MARLRAQGLHKITGDDLRRATDSLSDLLDRAVPIGFELLDWNSEMEPMLTPAYPESQWAHLKDNGVWHMTMPLDGYVFNNREELIGLLAIFVAATSAIVS